MSLTDAKFTPIALPSALTLLTSLAAVSTSLTNLFPPYWLLMDENDSIRAWMLGAI